MNAYTLNQQDSLEEQKPRILIKEVGYVEAKPIGSFKPGEVFLGHGGWKREIVTMTPQKGGRVTVLYRDEGKIYEKTYRKSTLMAIADKEQVYRRES